MKKILLFGVMLLLASCSDVPTYLSKEDQSKNTTLELQNKCDTLQSVYIVEKGSYLYILDKDRTVIIKTDTPNSINETEDVLIICWFILIFMISIFFISL